MTKPAAYAPFLALALLACWPTRGNAAGDAPLALQSVSIDLPAGSFEFPPGPGADAMNGNCTACHSTGMVLNQPALPKAVWDAEVQKMINVYKAPVAAEDVPAIVAYLDRLKETR